MAIRLLARKATIHELRMSERNVDDALLNEIMEKVAKHYWNKEKIAGTRLVTEAAKGMVQSLDPHSSYLTEKDNQNFRRSIQGEYGGIGALVARARELSDLGELRLACHLVEMAVQADPDHREAHAARAEVYAARRDGETSLD